jgi:inner membrane protein
MATAFSHAAAALAIGSCFYRRGIPMRVWAAGAICSLLPDLDAIGFRYGIRYGDFWGHRGFTHSLVFAALLAGAASVLVFRRGAASSAPPPIGRAALFAYLFLATASHGVLDAMTSGGLGVAFFSPFDNSRYFLPWRPILVSPISVGRFFSPRAQAILGSEFIWIWIPAILLSAFALLLRARAGGRDQRSKVFAKSQ